MFLYCHINTLTCANLHLLSTLSSTGHGGTSTEAAARNQRVTTQGSGTPKRRKGQHLNWEMEGALDNHIHTVGASCKEEPHLPFCMFTCAYNKKGLIHFVVMPLVLSMKDWLFIVCNCAFRR